jgi:hypothetical protein
MRRLIALSLTVLFSLTLIAPLFASDTDANLPACCRRSGRHHCAMRMMVHSGAQQEAYTSVTEKCPCPPVSTCAVYSLVFKPEFEVQFNTDVACNSAIALNNEAGYSASSDRSHPKRGPPSPLA